MVEVGKDGSMGARDEVEATDEYPNVESSRDNSSSSRVKSCILCGVRIIAGRSSNATSTGSRLGERRLNCGNMKIWQRQCLISN